MAKIIITDDEPMNLKMCDFILTKNGYETVTVSSGEKCLEELKNGADLVLLDVLMPGISGFETYERIRNSGYDAPVVFLTAAEDDETLSSAGKYGICCLRKPFKPKELIEAVKNAINGVKGSEKRTV